MRNEFGLYMSMSAGIIRLSAGDEINSSNLINTAAVLFMWVTMPVFGADAY